MVSGTGVANAGLVVSTGTRQRDLKTVQFKVAESGAIVPGKIAFGITRLKTMVGTALVALFLALTGCGGDSNSSSGASQKTACDFPDGWGRTAGGGCSALEAEKQWTKFHRVYHNAKGWQDDPNDWHKTHGRLRSRFPNPKLDHSCTNNCVGGAH